MRRRALMVLLVWLWLWGVILLMFWAGCTTVNPC